MYNIAHVLSMLIMDIVIVTIESHLFIYLRDYVSVM